MRKLQANSDVHDSKLLWITVAFVVVVLTFETIYAGVRYVAHMHDQPVTSEPVQR
jgi:hypothetical protein